MIDDAFRERQSALRRERTREAERRRRRRAVLVWILRLVVVGLVFFAGLALGRALEDAPRPGGSRTLVRTLEAGTVQPSPKTVTVTVDAR